MSADHAAAEQVRSPDHGDVEKQLGEWPTIAGPAPTAEELLGAAEAITDNGDETTEQLAMQSLRYVWRRQDMPHGKEWKDAEDACRDVLEVTRR